MMRFFRNIFLFSFFWASGESQEDEILGALNKAILAHDAEVFRPHCTSKAWAMRSGSSCSKLYYQMEHGKITFQAKKRELKKDRGVLWVRLLDTLTKMERDEIHFLLVNENGKMRIQSIIEGEDQALAYLSGKINADFRLDQLPKSGALEKEASKILQVGKLPERTEFSRSPASKKQQYFPGIHGDPDSLYTALTRLQKEVSGKPVVKVSRWSKELNRGLVVIGNDQESISLFFYQKGNQYFLYETSSFPAISYLFKKVNEDKAG